MEMSFRSLKESEDRFRKAKAKLDEIERVGFDPKEREKLIKHYATIGCATDVCLMRVFNVSDALFYSIKSPVIAKRSRK